MPNKSQSILLAGAAVGVAAIIAAFIPIVGECLACILYVAAGGIAVWHYTDRHQLTMKGGQGLVLGALAGLVAGIVQTVLDQLLVSIGAKPGWREEMQQNFGQSGMDPAQIEQILEWLSSPMAYVGIVLVALVMCSVGGGIGGAIGANVFKRESEYFDEGFESPDTDS